MDIEYEATFQNIDKKRVRQILKESGAKLSKKEFLQRRVVFNLHKGHEIKGGWLRVRDETDKITMSLKIVDGNKIHNQKEAVEFLGEPIEKIISILEWNTGNKPYYEYVENWKWEKPVKHYLLFNKDGKVHNKIQQAIMTGNFNNKDLNNFKAISSDKWLNN